MIKMGVKCIFPLMLVVLPLGGCNADESSIIPVKMLIGGGWSTDYCLFEIDEKGTIDVTSFIPKDFDIRQEDIIEKILERKTFKLSSADKKLVADLILVITKKKPKKVVDDANIIIALIENKMYSSTYDGDFTINYDTKNYNKDLARLAYKLVELLPIQVGGEHNPLTVPENFDENKR